MPLAPFISVYSINAPLGTVDAEIHRTASCAVEVRSGPIRFLVAQPVRTVYGGGISVSIELRQVELPDGRYLVISTERGDIPKSADMPPGVETGELAARIALLFPGLLDAHWFEGFVSRPHDIIYAPRSPVTLSAAADTPPTALSSALAAMEIALQERSSADLDRFRLACRWYERGIASPTLVDRILNWYIALEVHPAKGTTKVPNAVSRYLREHIYPDLTDQQLKDRTGIGRLTSLRGDIVHQGLAEFGLGDDLRVTRDLERLDALVRVCLRLLAGLPDDGLLDRWIRSDTG